METLQGKVVVLTGASEGIGRALALELARGRIVAISSLAGIAGVPTRTGYRALGDPPARDWARRMPPECQSDGRDKDLECRRVRTHHR